MAAYLLDTSVLSAYLQLTHENHARAQEVFEELPAQSEKFASVVTLAEMEFGLNQAIANGSTQVSQIKDRVDIVRSYAKLDITHHTATAYAGLKSKLAQHIQPKVNGKKPNRWPEEWLDANTGSKLGIDENDLWIAAQAKERDLTIITGDRDFELFEQFDPDIRVVYVCPPRAAGKPARPGRSRRRAAREPSI